MNLNYTEFEQPIAELEAKIEELRSVSNDADLNITDEIEKLKKKSEKLTESIFSNLTPWQVTQIARHPQRPHVCDYIENLFTDFDECMGDRHYADGKSIMGGIGRLDGKPVMIIGHQKGRGTTDKLKRNFGMPRPEGYRRALRLMEMAEKFKLPIFTFIDTPGAYPGIGAEERGQSEAIARNLFVMSKLKTPIICTVTGEGGSGGALALGVGDQIFMLQYSIYSVISPEGCASILWRSAEKASDAAEALGLTAEKILSLGLIDGVIEEPLGAAHRDIKAHMANVKNQLLSSLDYLEGFSMDKLLEMRMKRCLDYGT